jgi:histidine ammonia-lyase
MSTKPITIEPTLLLDGETLDLDRVITVARGSERVGLDPKAKERMAMSRKLVDNWVEDGKIIYGITTGFGSLQNVVVPHAKVEQLQENIILSHSAGIGNPIPEEAVRAMMLLRANALAKGYSGIRIEVVERLLEMLNERVHPVVPEKGSVGSSGDLAPLAHMTLVLIGRGEATCNSERMSGLEALNTVGIKPVVLTAKEGLALTNGTQFMTAIGALTVWDAEIMAKTADISGAMSLEALKGKSSPFLDKVQALRPYPGQGSCAKNVRRLVTGSALIDVEDKDTEAKRQDSYSLRCMPQVHGASRQAIVFVKSTLNTEINSATDNPLILFDEGEPVSVSAGNFHGQPVALAMDFLALALSELGNISERRTAKLMDRSQNFGLPAYLIRDSGINSGMMIAQYAAAALASENKVLIHPASGDSIPTSANQEDHNSMGSIAARQAQEVLQNVVRIVAIEILCAAQALGIREHDGQTPGAGTLAAYRTIRKYVPQMEKDREIYLDIGKVENLVRTGELLREVEQAVGPLD